VQPSQDGSGPPLAVLLEHLGDDLSIDRDGADRLVCTADFIASDFSDTFEQRDQRREDLMRDYQERDRRGRPLLLPAIAAGLACKACGTKTHE
jgi:hypothetical protein